MGEAVNPTTPVDVSVVAAEEFIPSVARQRHDYLLARQLAYEQSGDFRWIGEWLVEDLSDSWNRRQAFRAGDDNVGVTRT